MFKVIRYEKNEGRPVDRIEYFGEVLYVFSDHKYIATDKSGKVFSFKEKPVVVEENKEWWSDQPYYQLGLIKYQGDWRDSLVATQV